MIMQKLKGNFYKAAGQAKVGVSFKQHSHRAIAILVIPLIDEAQ